MQPPNHDYSLSEASEGFMEISPKPKDSELQKYYHNKYYQLGLGSYEVKYSQAELTYFENRLSRLNFLLKRCNLASSSPDLLDIGCGEGFATAYFARKGFAVSSIDYSSAGISQQNPEVITTHEVGDIFSILNQKIATNQRFDVLILQNVLEHVVDPYGLCNMMEHLLRKSGVALITVPNDFSRTQLAALEEGHISEEFWVSPPDHLNYFNTDTLKHFLESQGWDILDMISDFPVDWFLFHKDSNYITDKSKGKSAHRARISIENMIHSSPLDKVISFYRAAASLGIGRDITALIRPKCDK